MGNPRPDEAAPNYLLQGRYYLKQYGSIRRTRMHLALGNVWAPAYNTPVLPTARERMILYHLTSHSGWTLFYNLGQKTRAFAPSSFHYLTLHTIRLCCPRTERRWNKFDARHLDRHLPQLTMSSPNQIAKGTLEP